MHHLRLHWFQPNRLLDLIASDTSNKRQLRTTEDSFIKSAIFTAVHHRRVW